MNHFGNTIREIRLSKNLKLAELANGIVSVPFLSNYETGKSDISASKFLMLLDRLNVTYQEFQQFDSSNNPASNKKFLRNLSQAVYSDNISLLNDLLKKEEIYFKSDNNDRHLHNMMLIQLYTNRLCHLPNNRKQIKVITDYLEYTEDWGDYEVHLFGNAVIFMPPTIVNSFLKKVEKKTAMYVNKTDIKHDLSLVVINILIKKLDSSDFDNIHSLFELAKNLLNKTKFYYGINKVLFIEGLYLIKIGKVNEGRIMAEESIATMERMKDFDVATAHKKELEKYLI